MTGCLVGYARTVCERTRLYGAHGGVHEGDEEVEHDDDDDDVVEPPQEEAGLAGGATGAAHHPGVAGVEQRPEQGLGRLGELAGKGGGRRG